MIQIRKLKNSKVQTSEKIFKYNFLIHFPFIFNHHNHHNFYRYETTLQTNTKELKTFSSFYCVSSIH